MRGPSGCFSIAEATAGGLVFAEKETDQWRLQRPLSWQERGVT